MLMLELMLMLTLILVLILMVMLVTKVARLIPNDFNCQPIQVKIFRSLKVAANPCKQLQIKILE